eukprot:11637147-Ditylum_brightwellii.AAC.1
MSKPTEKGSVTNDSGNSPSNSRKVESNKTNIDPNAFNTVLTEVCPIDRRTIARMQALKGDKGLITLAEMHGHTNTDKYVLG